MLSKLLFLFGFSTAQSYSHHLTFDCVFQPSVSVLFVLFLFPYANNFWGVFFNQRETLKGLTVLFLHLFFFFILFSNTSFLPLLGPEKGRCVASEYFTEPEIEITTENTANIL
ncbi:hypothetical protein XENORESO_007560, partial [Xenotaenia resolanae]